MSKTVEIDYADWLEYSKLEEENKRLREFNIELNEEYKNSLKQIEEISNNYNKLKEENEELKLQIKELEEEIDRLNLLN